VHAGSQETLVAQIRAFVARARDAGVEITFSEYLGMVHVWHLLRAVTPDAQRAIDEAGAFIRARGVAPA
jgi:acetyl esterase/lipase